MVRGMVPTSLDCVSIILVEPQSPGNIGMVCRAMANFGVDDLRLVNPCQHLHPEARKFAVGAAPLLGTARLFPTLAAALADLQFSFAATRRPGRLRGELLTLASVAPQWRSLVQGGRLGLVFGREDAGLTTEEVTLCSHAVTIPTSTDLGSLNLAQAVLIFLYALNTPVVQHVPEISFASSLDLANQGELEALFSQMEEVLARIAYINPKKPGAVMLPLREIHRRAALSHPELNLLRGLWRQLAESVCDWPGRRRGSPPGEKTD